MFSGMPSGKIIINVAVLKSHWNPTKSQNFCHWNPIKSYKSPFKGLRTPEFPWNPIKSKFHPITSPSNHHGPTSEAQNGRGVLVGKLAARHGEGHQGALRQMLRQGLGGDRFSPGVGSGNASGGKSHWSCGGSGHRNLGSWKGSSGYLLQFANWKMVVEIVDLAHLPLVDYWRWKLLWVLSLLVGGFNPSEKYESQLGLFSQCMEQ